MTKLTMKRVRIAALRQDRKAMLERLQRLGVLEIEAEEAPGEGFSRPDTEAQAQAFERQAALAEQALAVLADAVPEKKGMLASLSGRREVEDEELARTAAESAAILQDCRRVLALQRQKAEGTAERTRLLASLAQLEPWERLDVPFRFAGTRTTAAFIGALPAEWTLEGLAEALAAADGDLLFDGEILSSSPTQTCVFLLTPKRQAAAMEQALRGLGFTRPAGAARAVHAAAQAHHRRPRRGR